MALTISQRNALQTRLNNGDIEGFYGDLESFGDPYGRLGGAVTTNTGWQGKLANGFAQSGGGDDMGFGESKWIIVNTQLAEDYFEAINNNGGGFPTRDQIQDLHNEVFTANGLDANDWFVNKLLNDSNDPDALWTDFMANQGASDLWDDAWNVTQSGAGLLFGPYMLYKALLDANGIDPADLEFARNFLNALAKMNDAELQEMLGDFTGNGPITDLLETLLGLPNIPTNPLSGLPANDSLPTPNDRQLPGSIGSAQEPWDLAPSTGSPLVLDLDGDGIELTTFNAGTSVTAFDIDGDGFAEQTAWITANQDGLLVRDINDNGWIDDVTELFGSPSIDGFALLATLDDNGDHRIDQYDAEWSDLLIWKDVNGDAITQSGELLTLASLNIASIDLAGVSASTSTINGNAISHTSSYTMTNGTTRQIVDAWFTHDNVNTYFVGDYTLDMRALFLPTLRGFGELPDLHIAMSLDEDLLGLVYDLASGYSLASFDSASGWNEAIEDILYKWAGVDGVNPTSRGPNIDARQLEFLEKFFGESFVQLGQTPNPGNMAGVVLGQSWTIVAEHMRAQLLLQSGADDLFTNEVIYNPYTGEIEGDLTLSQTAIIDLEDFATDVGVDTEEYWIEVARFLDATKGFENLTVAENGWMNTSIVATDAGLTWNAIKAQVNYDSAGTTIVGTSGNDTLTGTSLGEQIQGQSGNDTLDGLAGDDELLGGSGSDILYGGSGNDELNGEGDNDILNGGSGGDVVEGNYGDDTFVYTSGDDVYSDINGTETIVLPSGITSGNLLFHRVEDDAEGIHSLFITVGSLGTIELTNHFTPSGGIQAHLETITFADTSTLSLASIASITTHGGSGNDGILSGGGSRTDTIYGYAGDDYIQADDGNDTLDGGIGNDRLSGGAGDDTYIASEGFDLIESEGGGTDVIVLPASITTGDVHFVRLNSSPDDLLISIDGLGQIVIDNQFYQSANRVETVQFSSTSIDLTTRSIETIGSSGNDTMSGIAAGASTNDIFDGREGNDMMQGGSGDDIYYFSSGQDTVYESTGSSNDGIRFREGVSASDIAIYRGGYQGRDLILIDQNGNTLTVGSNFYDSQYLIEYAQFFSGTTWTFSAMEIETRGTSGNDAIWDNDIGDASRADTIYGYAGNDDLHGGLGNDVIYGGDGADNIFGEADSDTLYGDDGNDQIQGGDGNDTIYGGAGDDTIQAQGGTNVIHGGAGNDTLYGYGGTTTASYENAASGITANLGSGSVSDGDGGTDTLGGIDDIRGSAYADSLTGSTGNNVINGAAGNDIVQGGDGNDTLSGGDGVDTASYAAAASAVTVNLATLTSQNTVGAGSDTISGFENLTGSAFNDTLTGDGNANEIEGLAGNDTLNGSGGTDTLSYRNATAAVTVNLATTTAQNTVGAGTDTISAFENLIGSAFNDTLTGDGTANVIEGGVGNDTINGAGGTDTLTYANATAGVTVNLATTTAQNTVGAGTDTISNFENLTGSAFNDTLTGTSGNNVIEGGLGNDTINAQGGTDTLTYANAAAAVTVNLATSTAQNTVGAGTDTISNFENLTGSVFDDVLTGNTAANTINGGDGNDTIQGGAGNDTLVGGIGTDTASYTSAASAVTVNLATTTGQNTVGAGTDTISGFENLTGSAFNDTLTGTSTANTIIGGAGNDTINGGGGNDILYGSGGTDTITGSTGGDVFMFENASAFSNVDTVADFSAGAGDKFDFHDIIDGAFNPVSDAISNFVNFTDSGGNSILSIDRDGTGTTYGFVDVANVTGGAGLDETTLYNNGNLLAA